MSIHSANSRVSSAAGVCFASDGIGLHFPPITSPSHGRDVFLPIRCQTKVLVRARPGSTYLPRTSLSGPATAGSSRTSYTILAKAAQNNVVPPDLLTLDGKGVEVLSASWVPSKWRPAVAPMIDQKDLARIMLRNGQPGLTTRTVQYLLKGAGSITVKYASAKGGTAQKVIALQ